MTVCRADGCRRTENRSGDCRAHASRDAMLSPELRAIPGLTARRLGHWIQRGYINVEPPGSGGRFDWPDGELTVLTVLTRLVDAGLDPTVAARAARDYTPGGTVTLRHGVTLTFGKDTSCPAP